MAKRNARVFLDSNVIISGLLSDKGSPRNILDMLSLGIAGMTGITGEYNLIEVERNIFRKLPQAIPLYREYLPKLHLEVIPLPKPADIAKMSGVIADTDVPVLVSAIHGEADFLVTGDMKDFSALKADNGFSFAIVTPTEFLERIAEWLREA